MAPPSSKSSPEEQKTRICLLRSVFVASMVVAAAVCGAVAYTAVRRLELDLAQQTYKSVADSALKGAQAITRRKVQGGDVMASFLSYAFPDASQWPLVALAGFGETASKLATLSSSTSFSLVTIVRPEEASEFESFAQKVYQDQGYPEAAGTSEFGFGIWATDHEASPYTDKRFHDISGNTTTYESKYSIMIPVFLHINVTAKSLMYNVHSDVLRGTVIDAMLDCAARAAANGSSVKPPCSVVTEFVELVTKPGPAVLLYQPVYPANDPTTIVGLVADGINWNEVLTDVVPDLVDGLECVISTKRESYTYVIYEGVPELVGQGDRHDRKFDSYAKSVVLNDIETNAAETIYTLTVYPTDRMFDAFQTNSSLAISLGFVAVILFCVALFFLYDFFMRHESRQRKIILEVKRRFVRFVSHEIRTPLNTVCLGLELLQSEMSSSSERECKNNEICNGDKQETVTDCDDEMRKYWQTLTCDILENANIAVGILNDLLNYDKIEQGTFKLEVETVHIWELVERTATAFQIQAQKREIKLNVSIGEQKADEDDFEDARLPDLALLHVVGDDLRLRQVVRNLISNSLKFSPEGTGIIQVTATHNPEGLPEATAPRTGVLREAMSHQLACSYPRAGSILVSVRDNGAGMTQEQLSLLFQEGVQFDANKLQCGGGSGLGLHISKGLVEQHGGNITMDSEGPGLGATVTMELPLYEFPEAKRAQSVLKTDVIVESVISAPKNNPRKEHHVLVVDDSLSNRKMLVRLLERLGHTCQTACNGQEAINMFDADKVTAAADPSHTSIDTILMDYEMPILNGPEATKLLQENGCTALVIGVTGNVLVEDVGFFKSMGAHEVLAKPVQVALLEQYWEKYDK